MIGEKKCICEKTPSHIYHIDNMLSLFPAAKIVIMLRDGRDVACSIQKRTGKFEDGVYRWLECNKVISKIDDRVLVIKYEDLILYTERTLATVCAHIGIPYEESMLKYHKKKRCWFDQKEVSKPDNCLEENHRAYRNWQINQPLYNGSGRWETEMALEERVVFSRLAGQDLIALGYATDGDWVFNFSKEYTKNIIKSKSDRIARLANVKKLIENNPRPALNNLDEKLAKYLDFEGGYFVELGANDGYNQSNTFYLEYIKNWRGLLIEGIPELYTMCKYNRLGSDVVHCACVSEDYKDDKVMMRYADLMSLVSGSMKTEKADDEHIGRGLKIQNIKQSYAIKVPARTLTSILEDNQVEKIDFLSLDVEGYEANVLRGLDFDRYAPKYICVESRFFDDVNAILCQRYSLIEQLTHHDYLYRRL